jgi:hypothetical protein
VPPQFLVIIIAVAVAARLGTFGGGTSVGEPEYLSGTELGSSIQMSPCNTNEDLCFEIVNPTSHKTELLNNSNLFLFECWVVSYWPFKMLLKTAISITMPPCFFSIPGVVAAVSFVFISSYIIYYRHIHLLSKYPGPPLASFTNLWKAYQQWTLRMPETLVQLHEKYGDVVRVGPNDLSFNSADSVHMIYKAGRSLPKSGFYDGFTTFNPNLFGTRDEDVSYSSLFGHY